MSSADEEQEDGGHDGAEDAAELLQAGVGVARPRRSTVFSATMIPTPIATTMVEWPREKKYPNAERARLAGALPLAHRLAGGVVDRRDVVGVEGVPQAQGVGQ